MGVRDASTMHKSWGVWNMNSLFRLSSTSPGLDLIDSMSRQTRIVSPQTFSVPPSFCKHARKIKEPETFSRPRIGWKKRRRELWLASDGTLFSATKMQPADATIMVVLDEPGPDELPERVPPSPDLGEEAWARCGWCGGNTSGGLTLEAHRE